MNKNKPELAQQRGHEHKPSYWDMPGYSENDERAKIDAEWEAKSKQREAENKRMSQ